MLNFYHIITNNYNKINYHYLNRYITFINKLQDKKQNHNHNYVEKHHILPRSLFPKYEKDLSNIIEISGREHYICHWMLAKIFNGPMWFAFNQMKRIIKNEEKSGILYEMSRKYIAEQISLSNSGRPMSEKNKKAMSKRHKNTILVYDSLLNKNIRVSCQDKRYLSGELLPLQLGRKHSFDYKKNMSEKFKGRIACVGENDNLIYVYNEIVTLKPSNL